MEQHGSPACAVVAGHRRQPQHFQGRCELCLNPHPGEDTFLLHKHLPHSVPFACDAHPAKSVLSLPPAPSQAVNFWLSQTSCSSVSRALCPSPAGEAGISLVSIRISHRNQHIPVMLIYCPLGCQHKYLINTDMNNTG